MKKIIFVLVAGIALAALVSCSTMSAKGPVPTPTAAAQKIKMEKKTEVALNGTGFTPGKEIKLVVDIDGVMTNIGDDLKPEVQVDDKGTWKTTWDCSRLISRKLIKEGTYVLTVTDADYSPLTKTAIAFHK